MRRLALCTAATLLAATRFAAAEEIKQIIVEDNTKTTTDTVELIAKISVGDEWNADMVDRVKQDLVSSGLFKEVEVFYDAMPDGSGVRVHINVQDKHSWVIAPAFYNQPTNFGGGIGFGENNLLGTNQKLLLYGQIATGDSFFIGAWVIPSIGGTRFYAQLDTYLKSSRNIEYANPTKYLDDPKAVRESRMAYLNGGVKIGVEPLRGIKLDYRFRGAHVAYSDVKLAEGATIADVTGDPNSDPNSVVPTPGSEGWDVSSEIALTVDRRANWYGIATGYQMRASVEFATPSLGSDFHYYLANLSGYRAIKILDQHNLIFRGAVNYGHHLPFQQEETTGGTTMRGYVNNQFRGDFRVGGNAEYSVPIFTIHGFSVRGLGFFDTAYTTFLTTSNPQRDYLPNSQVRGLDGFKNSVGVGTRLYLRQIVLPLLGLDVGYGLEARDVQVYLAIGLTD